MEEYLAEVSSVSSQQEWRYGSYKVSIASEGLLENETQCKWVKFILPVYNEFLHGQYEDALYAYRLTSNFGYPPAVRAHLKNNVFAKSSAR